MKENKIEFISKTLFKDILQIGYSDNNELIYNSSIANKCEVLLLLEDFKYNLIRGVYDVKDAQD